MVQQTFSIHNPKIKLFPVLIKHNKIQLELYLAIISNMGEIYLDNVQANLISSFFNSILIPFWMANVRIVYNIFGQLTSYICRY